MGSGTVPCRPVRRYSVAQTELGETGLRECPGVDGSPMPITAGPQLAQRQLVAPKADACDGVVCGEHGRCEDGACACEDGFGGADCADVDECAEDNGGCLGLPCVNEAGSFRCGQCEEGFRPASNPGGGEECEDVDECADATA